MGDPHDQSRQQRSLAWVQHNKGPRAGRTPERIGPLIASLLADGAIGSSRHRRLRAVLAEHAGRALLDFAEPASFRDGVLTLEVADPAALYYLRLRWEQALLRIFAEHLPEAGIHSVRFSLRASGRRPES